MANFSMDGVWKEAEEGRHYLLLTMISLLLLVVISFGRPLFSLRNKTPPGPRPWPIFGSLFRMNPEEVAHRTFARLAEEYGPLMFMWLGSSPTVLISNAEMAEELIKNHDQNFASRPHNLAGKYFGFDYSNVVFQSYGPVYTRLRKIYTHELLSPKMVAITQDLRQTEVRLLLQSILRSFDERDGGINISSKLLAMGINNFIRMIFAKPTNLGADSCLALEEMSELKSVVKDAVELAGTFFIGDFVPIFRWLDFQGVQASMKKVKDRMRKVGRELIEKHRTEGDKTTDAVKFNVMDVLLALEGDAKLSEETLTSILYDFIIAGSDTTSVTTEWALAELLNHPQFLKRAQDELDTVVGKDRLVDASDIPNLPFLQTIVKETLRLHPPAPLGIPHSCKEASKVAGYDLPANTTAIINIWAIGRDPSKWENPLDFSPDRFKDSDLTMFGRDFQFLPFSVGRRQCPGAHLALAVVHIVLASLLHGFEWASFSKTSDSFDMTEKPGLVAPPAIDLVVSVKPRLPRHLYHLSPNATA